MTYENPIIPGFYPDPSVCRVGEDYYLVTSSFEFFPGVPLFHSRDLINWKQISYVLNRKSQLNLLDSGTSRGIFAPTIRHINNRFYMMTTNVSKGGNFYVYTDDINGDWSDPIYVDQPGIDPSIFVDDDGTAYFMTTFTDENGKACIGQFTIDIETGKRLSETKPIWYGTGGKNPEGPHMYKINGLYYLMIAEGGTEYGHMETIARADNPWGPFDSCPHNPIMSHKDISAGDGIFQALGHADLIETTEGKWWLVFHGICPTQFMFHHIGRETMIAPVEWDKDGWPVVNKGKLITAQMEVDDGNDIHIKNDFSFTDDFSSDNLNIKWSYLRDVDFSKYSLVKNKNYLTLTSSPNNLDGDKSPTFIGHRQQTFDAEITVEMEFVSENETEAGITVFHTNQHHYEIVVKKDDGKKVAFLRRKVVDMVVEGEKIILDDNMPIFLKIIADKFKYSFFVGTNKNNMIHIGDGSTQLISTECMLCTFTGCFIGLYIQGDENTIAKFKDYKYLAK